MEPKPYDYVPDKVDLRSNDTLDEFKKPSPPTHRIADLRGRGVHHIKHASEGAAGKQERHIVVGVVPMPLATAAQWTEARTNAMQAKVTTLQQRNPPMSVEAATVKPLEQTYDGMWEANLPYNAPLDQGRP